MGGMKTKGRGPDKKKRKPRAKSQSATDEPETPKKNIIRDIIDTVSDKVKRKEDEEPWSLDVEPVRVPMLGRHVFKKKEGMVEINLNKL